MTEEAKGKSKDKRLEDKERIDSEIARSLSVVKMKEAHKQIEDLEKIRKQSSIKSICERIEFWRDIVKTIVEALVKVENNIPGVSLKVKMQDDSPVKVYLASLVTMYDSVRFDLQRCIDTNKEDFEKLFPRLDTNFTTYDSVTPKLSCMALQMIDMKKYCLRLI